MALRYFRNGPATSLVAGIGAGDTIITVADASGFPNFFPYTLIIDRDQTTEEVVEVTAAAGNQLTITRGVDDTTAFPHSAGAVVVHGVSARDFREANTHVNTTSAVHGVTGALVGTTDVQTLSGKTLISPTISGGTADGVLLRDATVRPHPATANKTLSVRDVDGNEIGYIDRDGTFQIVRGDFLNDDPDQVGLVVKAASGQNADIVSVRNSLDTALITIDNQGRLGVGVDPGAITLYVQSPAATDVPFRIKRLAGQLTNLLTVVDENNSIMFWVDSNGSVHAPNLTNAGIDQGWQSITPAMANVGGATVSSRVLRWKRIAAKTVAFNCQIVFGSNGSGSAPTQFALPTEPSRTIRQTFSGYSSVNGQFMLQAAVTPDGSGNFVDEIRYTDPASEGTFSGDNIRNGMMLVFSGVYEEA